MQRFIPPTILPSACSWVALVDLWLPRALMTHFAALQCFPGLSASVPCSAVLPSRQPVLTAVCLSCLQGITGLWGLRRSSRDPHHSLVLLSYVGGSRLLAALGALAVGGSLLVHRLLVCVCSLWRHDRCGVGGAL
jgi:hypothetical protein